MLAVISLAVVRSGLRSVPTKRVIARYHVWTLVLDMHEAGLRDLESARKAMRGLPRSIDGLHVLEERQQDGWPVALEDAGITGLRRVEP